ncbi:MAG: pyridoxamine 5'-phosphate oxidase family protein [Actinomycetota bacterium]|nr:pyridoxamine 5'-phosphate oxidase family protein [Actinomycetota bacterium]
MKPVGARRGVEHLDRAECLRRLGAHRVGRVGLSVGGRPEIFPVNYVFDGEAIVFRTDPGTKLDAAGRADVCFEIDELDHEFHSGWSVVAHGRLEELTRYLGPDAQRGFALPVDPWAQGLKAHWLRIVPGYVSGRRIGPA